MALKKAQTFYRHIIEATLAPSLRDTFDPYWFRVAPSPPESSGPKVPENPGDVVLIVADAAFELVRIYFRDGCVENWPRALAILKSGPTRYRCGTTLQPEEPLPPGASLPTCSFDDFLDRSVRRCPACNHPTSDVPF